MATFSPQQIKQWLIDQGFLNPTTGVYSSLAGIYHAMQNYGITGAQMDEATGQPAGTTDNYIKQQGWAPLTGKDTDEHLSEATLGTPDNQLLKTLTDIGVYNPTTKQLDQRSIQEIATRYGLDKNFISSITARANSLANPVTTGGGSGGETGADQTGGSRGTSGGTSGGINSGTGGTSVDGGNTVINPAADGGGISNPVTSYTSSTGSGIGVSAPDVNPAQSNLSPVFGPYTMDMLGKTQALADLPYQPFEGQRFAEYDPLQQKAFQGIGGLDPFSLYRRAGELGASAQETLGKLSGGLYDVSNPDLVKKFMSPYTQNVTDIQKRELQRTHDIQDTVRNADAVRAGAFGGSRQGIVQAEADRNLQQAMADAQAKGDQNAYNAAVDAMLKERTSKTGEANAMLASANGLGSLGTTQLNAMLNAGQFKQANAQKPLDFGYQQFQDSLQYPWTNINNMKTALNGLPLTIPQQYQNTNPSSWVEALQGALGATSLWKNLFPNTTMSSGTNAGDGSGTALGLSGTFGTPNNNGGLGSIDTGGTTMLAGTNPFGG